MRYRLRFTKLANLRYIAHLDVLRVWQKALKKSKVGVCYSEGFNPHQKIALAIPLGLGLTSEAEYIDIFLEKPIEIPELINRINQNLPNGMEINFAKKIDEKEKNAMSQVVAAMYFYKLSDNERTRITSGMIRLFLENETIMAMKKTKTAVKEQNIREDIISISYKDDGLLFVLTCGSERNLKPILALKALYDFVGITEGPSDAAFHRKEILKHNGNCLTGLNC